MGDGLIMSISSIIKITVFGVFGLIFLALFLGGSYLLISKWRKVSAVKNIHNILVLFAVLAMFNLSVGLGVVESGLMGGTATNGKIENGRYYLGERGWYTEVSEKHLQMPKNL